MAQDLIVSVLVYLCIFQNHVGLSLRGGVSRESSLSSGGFGRVERRVRREVGGVVPREGKVVAEKFQEERSPRRWSPLLKGWGARGMPFNVLYGPNKHQQRMMKYVRERQGEGRARKEQRKKAPVIYNLVLEDERPPKGRDTAPRKHFVPRKYYSLIPQFFVSYGW